MPSVCKTPEAQKRCQRRDKRWLWGQRRGCAIVLQMGAAATLSRSDLPLPASGPRHSHVGPAPPSAPPASWTAAAGPEADHFLLPCAKPGSNPHAIGDTTRSRVAPLSGPHFRQQRNVRGREVSRYLERMGSCSPWCSVLPLQCFPVLAAAVTYLR